MKVNLFCSIIILIFFASTASAQLYCGSFENDYDKQLCEATNKRNEKAIYKTRFSKPDKNLLPDETEAWVLHLITFGGIGGQGLPTITITSDSSFACGEDENLNFNQLDVKEFESFSNIIKSANFEIDKSNDKSQDLLPLFCKDCYRTEILIARRDLNGKIKTYRNDSKYLKYPRILNIFSSIQKTAFDLAECQ